MGDVEYYHNKGARDAVDRDYDPPHGVADGLLTWGSDEMSDHAEENAAYDQGYFHTRGQLDQGTGDYDPPSNSDCREAYDAGWEAAKNS
ncbi:MAG: hypothetical protein ACRELE_08595 [Gemmatimonadales bacterium]